MLCIEFKTHSTAEKLAMNKLWITKFELTHWGQVMHIYVIGSDNGLSLGRRQAITWTNAVILLIRPIGTNFSENLIKI